MREIVFTVERPCRHQLIARAEEGNSSIDAEASSSIDLHRQARQALKMSLGARHSECRILLVKVYPGLESLRCTYWPCLEIGN
jgi:hypothetical protein